MNGFFPGGVSIAIVFMSCCIAATLAEVRFDVEDSSIHVAENSKESLPSQALLRIGSKKFRPTSAVADLAISPDERFIVTLGSQLSVWDAQHGNEIWSANSADNGIHHSKGRHGGRALVFGTSSDRFFTTGPTNAFIIWEIASGNKTVIEIKDGFNHTVPSVAEEYALPPGTPIAIEVSRDGQKIALGSASGLIVANLSGDILKKFENRPTEVIYSTGPESSDRLTYGGHYCTARFSDDGRDLALVTSDQPEMLKIVDANTFAFKRSIPLKSWLIRCDFSPDGATIATTQRDEYVHVYDVSTGLLNWSTKIQMHDIYENYLTDVQFAPDGNCLAVAATDKSIYLLDSQTGTERFRLPGLRETPHTLDFAPDSTTLYSAGDDGIIRRWDLRKPGPIDLPSGTYVANAIAASPVSYAIAFDDDRGVIRLADTRDGSLIHSFSIESAQVSAIRFSPKGELLAAGGVQSDRVWVAIWNMKSFERTHFWEWPQGEDLHTHVDEIAFCHDSMRVAAVVSRQDKLMLWDLVTGDRIAAIDHNGVYGVSFSPTKPVLASGGWDSMVRLWDSKTGEKRATLDVVKSMNEKRPRFVYNVCYSPDGRYLAVGHDGLLISLWDTQNFEMRSRFRYHPSGGWGRGDMNFSPNGLWLCSTDMSSTAKLWDPYSGQKVMEFGPAKGTGYPLEFGAYGRTLVSGPRAGACYVWDASVSEFNSAMDNQALWNALGSSTALDAYRAYWALERRGNATVSFLAERLAMSETVIDSYEITKTLEGDALASRQELIDKMTSEDVRIVTIDAVRKSLSLLKQIGTEEATQLLGQLANHPKCVRLRDEARRVAQISP